MSLVVWVQKWEESEAGWGGRPDGYTLHLEREDITKFLEAMRAREAEAGYSAQNVPREYTRPSGRPYQALITDKKLMGRVIQSDNGCWGPDGNKYPPSLDPGADRTGWVTVDPDAPAEQPDPPSAEERTRKQLEEMVKYGERAKKALAEMDKEATG
jgi:hypothetical protein